MSTQITDPRDVTSGSYDMLLHVFLDSAVMCGITQEATVKGAKKVELQQMSNFESASALSTSCEGSENYM